MKTTNFILALILMMTLLNCNNNDKSNKSTTDEISIQDLKSEFDAGKQFYLLDVRTMPEFEDNRLSFSDDLIPYDSLEFNKDKLPQDKETVIYLFCRSSRRSGIATDYLRSIGYKNSYNVLGGIIAWQEAGFETVSGNL